ncbi:MAG: SGNH/GDSL hydrolase family protein [candidate division WS1 bacterium]|nr:SGNH/GDSL hydrolase family protein [candidate division WS1 bacterium]
MKLDLQLALGAILLLSAVCACAEEAVFQQLPARLAIGRDGLPNSLAKLQAGGPVTVAYIGGSVTAMEGWRTQTFEWLQKTYPQAQLTHINAAIGGTGSDLGVFRYERDVLRHQPDLVFVEFAINDGGQPPHSILRQMEGIVRQTWRASPHTDLCYVYVYRAGLEKDLAHSMCPIPASCDEMIANHYGIPSINVALRTVQLWQAGKLQYVPEKGPDGEELPPPPGMILWSKDHIHPLPAGHQVYTDLIAQALTFWAQSATPKPHPLPEPLVADNWENAQLVPLSPSMLSSGWRELSKEEGLGQQFADRVPSLWTAGKPGEQIHFKFKGTAVRLYDLIGPTGALVNLTLDGEALKPVPRFDWYGNWYRLAPMTIAMDLPEAVHEVTLTIDEKQPDRRVVTNRFKDDPDFDPKKYDGTDLWVAGLLIVGEIVD